MKPNVGAILGYKFSDKFTSVAPIRVVDTFPDKDIYILQNQITGQIEQYSSDQLDIYCYYVNRPNRGNVT